MTNAWQKKSLDMNESTSQTHSERGEQKSIIQAFVSCTPYERSSKMHKEITDAVMYHLCKDMVPANIVSKAGFQKMIQSLDKRYQLPSRSYFSRVAIPEMYSKCKASVELELKQVKYYATTSDMWSSRTSEPYLSLTVHFINDDFDACKHHTSLMTTLERICLRV